jgi:MFS family permease
MGAAPIACGGGVVGDLFSVNERARAMALYTLGPLIGEFILASDLTISEYSARLLAGPSVGPVAGGFISESIGFKYIFIILSALTGVSIVFAVAFFRETYAPVVRIRVVRKRDPENAWLAKQMKEQVGNWATLQDNLSRPFVMLTRNFIFSCMWHCVSHFFKACCILIVYFCFSLQNLWFVVIPMLASMWSPLNKES